jgi:hypothetical protein
VKAQIRDVPGAAMSEINKYFLNYLKNYWYCEARDRESGTDLLRALNHPNHKIDEQTFKALLVAAIEQHTIGLKEYEDITGLDFESPDEIAEDLRELWQMMYG